MTYDSISDVPDEELMWLTEELERQQGRALCEDCQLGLLGFDADHAGLLQVGEECVRCGYLRPADLQLYLSRATDALVDALLLGAAAADVEDVLGDARYFAVLGRSKRGEGEGPSKVLRHAGSAPSLVHFLSPGSGRQRPRPAAAPRS